MPAKVAMQLVASLLELDKIIICGGLKDTAKQGQAYVGGDIWDATKAQVCYINPAANLFDLNLLNAYNWQGDGGSFDFTVESFWDEKLRRNCIRARRQIGTKVEYPECGHLLTAVTA
jgi:hypothetical protein